MNKIKRSFYITLIGSLLVFAGTIYLYLVLFAKYPNNVYVFISLFVVFFIYMYLLSYLQVKIEDIVMRKNNLLIRENQEPPKDIRRALNTNLFFDYLLDSGFKKHASQPAYTILYKTNTDPVKKIFKKKLLQVVILIDENESEYYLESVDNEIEKVKDQLIVDKIKVNTILISQYKVVSSLTQNIKNQLMENILLKNRYGLYSVINIALDESTQKAVFLHTLKYSPSLYYQFHIEQILESL